MEQDGRNRDTVGSLSTPSKESPTELVKDWDHPLGNVVYQVKKSDTVHESPRQSVSGLTDSVSRNVCLTASHYDSGDISSFYDSTHMLGDNDNDIDSDSTNSSGVGNKRRRKGEQFTSCNPTAFYPPYQKTLSAAKYVNDMYNTSPKPASKSTQDMVKSGSAITASAIAGEVSSLLTSGNLLIAVEESSNVAAKGSEVDAWDGDNDNSVATSLAVEVASLNDDGSYVGYGEELVSGYGEGESDGVEFPLACSSGSRSGGRNDNWTSLRDYVNSNCNIFAPAERKTLPFSARTTSPPRTLRPNSKRPLISSSSSPWLGSTRAGAGSSCSKYDEDVAAAAAAAADDDDDDNRDDKDSDYSYSSLPPTSQLSTFSIPNQLDALVNPPSRGDVSATGSSQAQHGEIHHKIKGRRKGRGDTVIAIADAWKDTRVRKRKIGEQTVRTKNIWHMPSSLPTSSASYSGGSCSSSDLVHSARSRSSHTKNINRHDQHDDDDDDDDDDDEYSRNRNNFG
eukprot:CAMPEP_0170378766 /NCGR_PEP_ID=MMETSP0117_2-20130122/12981_1 /TAXON_ID=400756 /ORGANISM="Durinskia baltica, Strain CSIRO CS-38" /LENGTH=508 /DNA_ID=CAMNT_0010634153 /DNA_START=65 /DNA_END=1591 /DNA_ORIENTATION=-